MPPLKRSFTIQGKDPILKNLESEQAFVDLFNDDIEEPACSKQQKVDDNVNRFVNYKETDSQIAEN